MIVDEKEIRKYLMDFHEGKIQLGKGLNCELDKYIRFKEGSFNMIQGHDNVGKTYWRTWYYLCLSTLYDDKWCIWTGENKAGQIVRNLIQMLSGTRYQDLTLKEIFKYENQINHWFKFVDNKKLWKYDELLKIFGQGSYSGCLIDPYTGLDRGFNHSDNYTFLNQTRQWVNKTGTTIDVCTHPSTAAGRQQAIYPKGHALEGYLRAPYKADIEGGKPFANRCDDLITIHRLPDHPNMKYITMVFIQKIKDNETGGEQTEFEKPVNCEFNGGLGFTVGGINPLKVDKPKPEPTPEQVKQTEMNYTSPKSSALSQARGMLLDDDIQDMLNEEDPIF